MRILIRHPGVGKLAREVQLSVEPVDNLLDDGDRSRQFRGRTKGNFGNFGVGPSQIIVFKTNQA
jgi:hypothetical protein